MTAKQGNEFREVYGGTYNIYALELRYMNTDCLPFAAQPLCTEWGSSVGQGVEKCTYLCIKVRFKHIPEPISHRVYIYSNSLCMFNFQCSRFNQRSC